MGVLDFLRDVGKHVTVNYMLAKESVQQPRRERARHLVHRVQLHAAAGQRLRLAARAHGLRAAGRRLRPVGQHHRRHRPRRAGAPARPCTGSRCRWSRARTARSSARASTARSGSIPSARRPTRSTSTSSTCPTPTSSAICCSSRSCRSRRRARSPPSTREAPERRAGQQRLAWEMCALDPRRGGGRRGRGRIDGLHERGGRALGRAARGARGRDPHDAHRRSPAATSSTSWSRAGLAASKGEARRLIAGGGIYVNDVALAESRALGAGDLLHGRYVMLRKGKRQRHLLVSD